MTAQTLFFDGQTADTSDYAIRPTDDGAKLEIYEKHRTKGWIPVTTVPIGTHRLFRPDHDARFTSDAGRVWEPK